jgi:uncharacterized membrane protein SpoIIM required for sporulation
VVSAAAAAAGAAGISACCMMHHPLSRQQKLNLKAADSPTYFCSVTFCTITAALLPATL